MPHIERKQGEFCLHVLSLEVALLEGLHGKGVTQVMDAGRFALGGKYLESPAQD
jgi:hypothetical protein